jgi:hypothetical protein
MAVRNGKRSRTQAATRNKTAKALASKKRKHYRPSGAIPYLIARGKTLKDVYLMTELDFSGVTLVFDDDTELILEILPRFDVLAVYSEWKGGEERVIERWPLVRT